MTTLDQVVSNAATTTHPAVREIEQKRKSAMRRILRDSLEHAEYTAIAAEVRAYDWMIDLLDKPRQRNA